MGSTDLFLLGHQPLPPPLNSSVTVAEGMLSAVPLLHHHRVYKTAKQLRQLPAVIKTWQTHS